MTTLRIATRKSPLALWQTEHVAERLRACHPQLRVELVPLSTRGDEVLDRSLAAIGGKGLFLKELELAMQRFDADCAVHSLKDVPMELEPGFALAAILARADHADAFVSDRYPDLAALPPGARVGTSSLRRQAQLRARRPDLVLRDLRGNVNTRLAKLDAGDYDAIVLACAGLQRLGLDARIRARLDAPHWLPAPAQGAIAVECRAGDAATLALFAPLDDAPTRACVEAERAMNRALHGSCHVPVAAFARLDGARLHLQGLVGSVRDGRLVRAEDTGPREAPEALGLAVAERLLAQGARALIAAGAEPDTGPYEA
ncbi:hydroxymethylbilane synthase [Vulcaniibacterium gelatinicum]|uniref:hydroxymethylbilane synthase n=1 Tax=Vulcaniibacterium gelatinicum TaxID=2598725 RepID=UPI0011C8211E|nr:hydroxymethylbilane synthase [Vulcaniibacterium gelatinicum]